ncbi:MAG TPA: molybdopterin cofactor-binding domain-containing protein [Gemmatimonadales bacterium]|nr:molybdopterin cofactor-binding domain-containing protein [Gemmatimonadales bacterium]
MSEFRVIGRARRRVDGRAKVTGATLFADDIVLPRMLYAKLLRSPHPHARIARIDISRAAKARGVKLVLTGEHFPNAYGIMPVSQDEHALCLDVVRHVGDPVAAVVAASEAAAQDALELIEVDYKPLPTIADAVEALARSDVRIHGYGEGGNIHRLAHLAFGDVDEVFAETDVRVFEDIAFYEGNTHLPLEQHAAVAALDKNGRLTLWSSTQTPHYVHREVARALDIPTHQLRVVACMNGGGFGGKSDPFNHEVVVAKAALLLGRPVKITLTREEVFYCHRGRHPVLMRLKTAVRPDGRIAAMDLETLLDGGAYGSYGAASTLYTGQLQTVTYQVPRYRFRACRVFTNKPPCGPKRGHGTPQPRFIQEIQLDRIAETLKMDPADLRLMQIAEPGSITANWLKLGTVGLAECIRRVVEGSGWKQRRGKLGFGRGLGLACSSYLSGAGLPIYWNDMPHSGVQLQLDRSGRVTAFCGATEIGQGSDDVLAAIVAEVLGLEAGDVVLVTGDTDLTPVDLGSYSSRVTLMMGNAAIQAAERARAMLAEAVAAKLDVPASRLGFADRRVFDVENPDAGVGFAEAVALAETKFGTIGSTGSYRPPAAPGRYRGSGVGPSATYSYSAAVVEVEVDPATGIVRVPKVWIGHDIGRVINPVLARGQVEGGVYMGLGEALMEESSFRRLPHHLSGALVHKFPSMLEYKSLTTLEMPEVVTYFIEDADPNGPFGAKEVGQGPLLPIMPAVANAVYDAVGVRVNQVPITPEAVLKGIEKKRGAQARRDRVTEGGQGEGVRIGPTEFPRVPWPEALVVPPPWEGGDGKAVKPEPKLGVRV